MKIQMKQPEIEAALKLFITGQGINLMNKKVSIEFTSGRKDNGLTADLIIEDIVIPGFTSTLAVHAVGNVTPIAQAVEPAINEESPTKPPGIFDR